MSGFIFLITTILLFLNSKMFVYSHKVQILPKDDKLYAAETFNLQFISTESGGVPDGSNVNWLLPFSCRSVDDKYSGYSIYVVCENTGTFSVKVTANGESDFLFITLAKKRNSYCYDWQSSILAYQNSNTTTNRIEINENIEIHVWLSDFESDCTESVYSHEKCEVLTKLMNRMGETPSISLHAHNDPHIGFTRINDNENTYVMSIKMQFDGNSASWIARFKVEEPGNLLLNIEGKGNTVIGCNTRNKTIVLPVDNDAFKPPIIDIDINIESTDLSEMNLVNNACEGNIHLLLQTWKYHNDNNQEDENNDDTTTYVSVVHQLDQYYGVANSFVMNLSKKQRIKKMISLAGNRMVLLMADGSLYYYNGNVITENTSPIAQGIDDTDVFQRIVVYNNTNNDNENDVNSINLVGVSGSVACTYLPLKDDIRRASYKLLTWPRISNTLYYTPGTNNNNNNILNDLYLTPNWRSIMLSSEYFIYDAVLIRGRQLCVALVSESGPGSTEYLILLEEKIQNNNNDNYYYDDTFISTKELYKIEIPTRYRLHRGEGDNNNNNNNGFLSTSQYPSITISDDGTNEIILSGDSLLYSPNGAGVVPFEIYNHRGELIEVPPTTTPANTDINTAAAFHYKQVTINKHGAIAVLTSRSELYFGYLGLPLLVELNSGSNPTVSHEISFDATGKYIVIMTPSESISINHESNITTIVNSPPFDLYKVAVWQKNNYEELFKTLNLNHFQCAYMNWRTNLQKTILLDRNEKVTARFQAYSQSNTALTTSNHFEKGISISISSPKLIKIENINKDEINNNNNNNNLKNHEPTSSSVECYGTCKVVSRVVQIRESDEVQVITNRQEREKFVDDIADIRASPWGYSPLCSLGRPQHVSAIRVGCPATRHLRVRHNPSNSHSCVDSSESCLSNPECATECYCSQFFSGGSRSSYKIYQSSYSYNSNDPDLELEYDYNRFGCPIEMLHDDVFKPVLELWDANEFVRNVDADFVVYELNNRIDYTFTHTGSDVRCVREPMTWSKIRSSSRSSLSVPPEDAWNAANHQSCFVRSQDDDSQSIAMNNNDGGNIIYEILNATGVNNIKFITNATDGVFMFRARVVDPDYSYCDLQVDFAVLMFGSPMKASSGWLIFFFVVFIITGSLFASYFWFRRNYNWKSTEKIHD